MNGVNAKPEDLQKIDKAEASNPSAGHRRRLRERFMQSGLEGFLGYEIVELLLTLATPRKDCKQSAKEAINKFGGLYEVLNAPVEELQKIKGIGQINVFGLKLFQEMAERLAREKIPEKVTLNSSKAVADYLQRLIGTAKKEHFVMLSLDPRNNLIKTSQVAVGSLTGVIVHPREVFKEAIQASAAQIMIAHNHPSGDPEPTPEDVALTRRLEEAAKIFDIELLDHIIVTSDRYSSMKEQNLI